MARGSRIWPSANTTCSRTSALDVLHRDDQRLDRAAIAQLPEREGGIFTHVGVGVLQRGDERATARRIADLAECEHRLLADARRSRPARRSPSLRPPRRRASARARTPPVPGRSAPHPSARRSSQAPPRDPAAGRARRRPVDALRRSSSFSMLMSGSTARLSRSWPRPNAACSRTSDEPSFSACDQRLEHRRIAQLDQRVHRGLAHFLVGVLERGGQRGDHPGIDLPGRTCPWPASGPGFGFAGS